ncbi:MAG: membrane protein insertion efficiency factor YidD [Verrucomicrobiota bacterium]
MKLVRLYQIVLSPMKHALMGPGAGCRFQPTCSNYAIGCFRKLPFFRALWLSSKRICSCHPWGGSGYDPVPGTDPNWVKGAESGGSLKDLD